MNNNTNNDNNDKFKHVLSKRYTRTRYNYEFADLTEQLLKCLSKTEMDDDACIFDVNNLMNELLTRPVLWLHCNITQRRCLTFKLRISHLVKNH